MFYMVVNLCLSNCQRYHMAGSVLKKPGKSSSLTQRHHHCNYDRWWCLPYLPPLFRGHILVMVCGNSVLCSIQHVCELIHDHGSSMAGPWERWQFVRSSTWWWPGFINVDWFQNGLDQLTQVSIHCDSLISRDVIALTTMFEVEKNHRTWSHRMCNC